MGCAIGMSVAAACEIIYWLTLKPVAKLLANVTLTGSAKYFYEKIFLLLLLSLFTFTFYQFRNVFITFIGRSYDINEIVWYTYLIQLYKKIKFAYRGTSISAWVVWKKKHHSNQNCTSTSINQEFWIIFATTLFQGLH